ncbi:MAG: BamA/TamA family outer membrane protein [Candidatus Omnitrophica bacterium]|nr:BamA/TamA family outer membrane protein [Candidatus Omnitrophota bacterium]
MRKSYLYLYSLILILISLSAACLFIVEPVYAQSRTDVERATRETDLLGQQDEKIQEKLRQVPKKPAEVVPKDIPVPKDEKKFLVKRINLVGCESFPSSDFAPILSKYENQELSLTMLENIGKEIEREYLRRGIISAVFLPVQEVKEGTVTMQVVEARMGKLLIQEHRFFNAERLKYYWRVPENKIIQYDLISRSIQMMNKNPDRTVKAALRAGTKPGTTDVILTADTHFPLHATASFDNEGTVATGKSRIGTGFRHNNFLGLDDTLLGGYTFGQAFNGVYAYHSVPISPVGTSLLYGFSRSKSVPKKEFAAFGLNSVAYNYSWSVHQDIYKKDEYLGEMFFGFDAKDKTTRENAGVDNRDRLRIFSLGGNFIKRGFTSVTSFAPEFAQGVDAFGASSRGNPLASRNAKSNFSKFNLGIQHKKILPLNLQGNLKFKSQVSSTKLTPQEEFSLGGIDSVRGYPAGDYLADNALLASAELLVPAFFVPSGLRLPYAEAPFKDQTTLVLFTDYGWGDRRGALATDKKEVNFVGVGAGLRFRLYNQALLRLEWGFPVGDPSITEAGHSRFHFSVDLQEKLPEEVERIQKMRQEENIKKWAWDILNKEYLRFDSHLRMNILNNFTLAKKLSSEGKSKEAKEYYEKSVDTAQSLYNQAEEYVRSSFAHEQELRDLNKQAQEKYKAGNISEAKQLWQKIIDEANPKQLVLEY